MVYYERVINMPRAPSIIVFISDVRRGDTVRLFCLHCKRGEPRERQAFAGYVRRPSLCGVHAVREIRRLTNLRFTAWE